jgi:hypothetical protein
MREIVAVPLSTAGDHLRGTDEMMWNPFPKQEETELMKQGIAFCTYSKYHVAHNKSNVQIQYKATTGKYRSCTVAIYRLAS